MKIGKIINRNTNLKDSIIGKGDFSIEFDTKTFGPYNWLYSRENLYYNENLGNRGSYFFPLKNTNYDNTEIFLETDDIVIAIGERGSFSGTEKKFVEIVNFKTQNKYRFYPNEISLIYNSPDSIIVYYKKGFQHYKLTLDRQKTEKISESSLEISAFFKLYYNHNNQKFGRIVFHSETHNSKNGYFVEEEIAENSLGVPTSFSQESFRLWGLSEGGNKTYTDVWEASLTGNIHHTILH